MRLLPSVLRTAHARAATLVLAGLVAVCALAVSAATAATAVDLGTANSFAVLAGAGITNTGPTTVGGDIGTFPTTSITGTATLTVNGVNHGGDAVTQQAKSDLVAAYDAAAAQGPQVAIVGDLGGQTLTPGVYTSGSSIGLTGVVTLNGGGDANAVFVFQAGSSLTTASTSEVALVNGAQSCNVFWQVGSSATLGSGSTFRGTILALTDITVTTGVTVDGRVLARNGAVTLDTDTITRPTCTAAPAPAPTPTPTPAAPAPSAAAVAAASAAQTAAAQAAAAQAAAAQAAATAQAAADQAAAAKLAAAKAVAAARVAAAKASLARLATAKIAAAKAAAAARIAAAQAASARAAADRAAASARVAAAKVTAAKALAARKAAAAHAGRARAARGRSGFTG